MTSKRLTTAMALAVMPFAAACADASAKRTDDRVGHRAASASSSRALLAYLRCEEVALNQFGEAQVPVQELALLAERFASERPDREPSLIPIEVWPGTQARLKLLAGYGFFAVAQLYPLEDKAALLEALAAAGWAMKRLAPSAAAPPHHPSLALVPTYEGSQPMGKRVRVLMLTEAHVDEFGGEITLDGVTLTCTYRAKEPR